MVISRFIQSIEPLLAKFGIFAPDVRVERLVLDSRDVSSKTAFIAVKGHALDGREFIPQAISLGAPAIIAETDDPKAHGHCTMRHNSVIVEFYDLNQSLSALAAAFYDYPATKMTTIAVTGTNGKTSVVQLLSQLRTALGVKCGMIGTLGSGLYQEPFDISELDETRNTTPDAVKMHYILADLAQQDVHQVAFEASSHALVQGRLNQVKTDVAVFTNLTHDHLDYHGSMEAYAKAKRRLLEQPALRHVVLNADDAESMNWAKHSPETAQIVWFGIDLDPSSLPDGAKYCSANAIRTTPQGLSFELATSWGSSPVQLGLVGKFNAYNALAAAGVVLSLGTRFSDLLASLKQLQPVPGRMELFRSGTGPSVIVDYAHTPDALEHALAAASAHKMGDLWCVFGCGGERDKGKRPHMGKVAAQGADHVVLTADNARTETVESISQDIRSGIDEHASVTMITDRKEAIAYALKHAKTNDIVLLAGKGHENYQDIQGQRIAYDERAYIPALLKELTA
ncbi:UDP-N-acetylmuramoyl-L-alanyl-D-glutamate--2,6-diaminopimelate ligase [Alteromonas oceanisediminis]|uniref:UDP-N-acetylmuramoyl-L-alanyl-D-glutamate--2, 6-diaminopimelate ligase n=1 Tax=Alteromonas oceanisediminis TaxID=2836180 RepID=UPI001BD9A030|nr:UDP-N-acetylmuramoyl-L-alanyl-D-glutamate--2,6-diaminopimelate ligase [Alteromonas oceanisediminis]MBT0585520.1 UDP-N-acetylmuramoyl-L-alanyl-D-glutamate--2,6-diaminopimelate ligase [Alteromonas oceanisediminis]